MIEVKSKLIITEGIICALSKYFSSCLDIPSGPSHHNFFGFDSCTNITSKISWTPLDQGSARRSRDLYLTTLNTQ